MKGRIIFNKNYKNKDTIKKDSKFFIIHSFNLTDEAKMVFYQDITKQEEIITKSFHEALLLSLVLFCVIFIILHYGFKVLIKRLELSENSLKNLNANLEQKIQLELQKRREQERILMHQGPLASMGEMIGNIAHQWRQPLTELNTILTHISLMLEFEKIDYQNFKRLEKNAESLISYMSKTIDDFRNFFKPNVSKNYFYIDQALSKTLKLLESSFNFIKIEENFEKRSNFMALKLNFAKQS
ncbi:hypothetical protein ACRCD5_03410 [Campylobacter taeniopygiae]|uniref:hypothetical protein n=1 Tax=Campylobacter taeniopygiae TaxID=2510188 RepID=UPI003D6C1734